MALPKRFVGRTPLLPTRRQLKDALAAYREARDRASTTGDWSIWAAVFTRDAHYIEHAYGELHGREAICTWITDVMAPYPHMTFPQDWVVFDEERGAVLFQCQNRFPDPPGYNGPPLQFPNWTRLVYRDVHRDGDSTKNDAAPDGYWRSEEDIYNPARDAPRVFTAWIDAGGQVLTAEQVGMKHR
ncbi:MAG: hypothetical protein ACI8TX_002957 [Hyphomicrobiaceae bacterium]